MYGTFDEIVLFQSSFWVYLSIYKFHTYVVDLVDIPI